MSRPLLITDCDEVLLHMVVPFRDWLDERHEIHFDFREIGFINALRRKACGTVLEQGEVWDLLSQFFDTDMHRQMPIEGALDAMERISRVADIVVLTNIGERHHQLRIEQLRAVGLEFPVHWNQGGKGAPLAALVERYRPSVAFFVDDLPQHHESVEHHAPSVWRLHMVGEPAFAPLVGDAPRAHARIDRWAEAEQWIMDRMTAGPPPADHPVVGGTEQA